MSCLERSRAGAEGHAVDGQHPEGEAGVAQHVREVDPGRDHPGEAHDLHLLQLRPPGADPRQLGLQPRQGTGQHRHLRDATLRSDGDVRGAGPDGAQEHSQGYKISGSTLQTGELLYNNYVESRLDKDIEC